MNREIQQRLLWIRLYDELGDAGLVCRRCGISRPTLRKWWHRYQDKCVDGLVSQSRRPHSSPGRKVESKEEQFILAFRTDRNLLVTFRQCGCSKQMDINIAGSQSN